MRQANSDSVVQMHCNSEQECDEWKTALLRARQGMARSPSCDSDSLSRTLSPTAANADVHIEGELEMKFHKDAPWYLTPTRIHPTSIQHPSDRWREYYCVVAALLPPLPPGGTTDVNLYYYNSVDEYTTHRAPAGCVVLKEADIVRLRSKARVRARVRAKERGRERKREGPCVRVCVRENERERERE